MTVLCLILGTFISSTLTNGEINFNYSHQIQLSNNENRIVIEIVFSNTNGHLLSLTGNNSILSIYIGNSGADISIFFYNDSIRNNLIKKILISEFCDCDICIYEIIKLTIISSNKCIILECNNQNSKNITFINILINNKNFTLNLVGHKIIEPGNEDMDVNLNAYIRNLNINGKPFELSLIYNKKRLNLDGVNCIHTFAINICDLKKDCLNDEKRKDDLILCLSNLSINTTWIEGNNYIENNDFHIMPGESDTYNSKIIRNITIKVTIIELRSNEKKSFSNHGQMKSTSENKNFQIIIIISIVIGLVIIIGGTLPVTLEHDSFSRFCNNFYEPMCFEQDSWYFIRSVLSTLNSVIRTLSNVFIKNFVCPRIIEKSFLQ